MGAVIHDIPLDQLIKNDASNSQETHTLAKISNKESSHQIYGNNNTKNEQLKEDKRLVN